MVNTHKWCKVACNLWVENLKYPMYCIYCSMPSILSIEYIFKVCIVSKLWIFQVCVNSKCAIFQNTITYVAIYVTEFWNIYNKLSCTSNSYNNIPFIIVLYFPHNCTLFSIQHPCYFMENKAHFVPLILPCKLQYNKIKLLQIQNLTYKTNNNYHK